MLQYFFFFLLQMYADIVTVNAVVLQINRHAAYWFSISLQLISKSVMMRNR